MNQIFRVWIFKNWVNAQEEKPRKVSIINKIIVKQSVLFYGEVWRNRNEVIHNLEKFR